MPRKAGRSQRPADSPSIPLEGLSAFERDRAEFLAALERIEPAAGGDTDGGGAAPRAQPRRVKQLERGTLRPAETLDLHGLTREEALPRTRAFLGHAARQGWAVVVIVTGKGLHSPTGPVLRQAVEQLLASSPQLLLEWAPAPRQYGGAGALVVFPRPQSN
jgi:DNA-nicking Smr family endonuclease